MTGVKVYVYCTSQIRNLRSFQTARIKTDNAFFFHDIEAVKAGISH
jgi:hypothetical protein